MILLKSNAHIKMMACIIGCSCFSGRLSERIGSIHDGFGNYTADVRCSWLIESSPNTKIRMHVEQFATECGWDHLYIYDGDSVEAPLLAVFSGLMHKDSYHIRRVPEVIARSGSALLHFYSDVAYNMSGFNITYKINACPSRWAHRAADCGFPNPLPSFQLSIYLEWCTKWHTIILLTLCIHIYFKKNWYRIGIELLKLGKLNIK